MKRTKKLTVFQRSILVLFAFLLPAAGFAQQITVKGEVMDVNNEPLIGVSIVVKGTTNGAITDLDGQFSLKVDPGVILQFSYIGYIPQEIMATEKMKVVLRDDDVALNEVVVIGYGQVQRKDVTTAVSSVSTKDLESRPIVSAAQGMQGKAAGLQITQANGQPGSSPTVRVRGTTSLNGSNNPLYVVDGVPLEDIDFLSADDIDNIQILKDASSAAIYGSRAANGVIIIGTKQGKEGVARISINASYTMSNIKSTPTVLNAWEYKELQDEIGLVKLPDGLTDQTNWKDETFRHGAVQNYQLQITNGTDKLRYFLSGGYMKEDGIIKQTDFNRYNFRAAVENDLRSWLRLNANIVYSDYTYRGGIISGTGANRGGVLMSVINTPTYAAIWDEEHPDQYNTNFYGVNIASPAENIARTKDNRSNYNKLIATGKATVTFMPDLKFTSSISMERTHGKTMNFLDPHETLNGRNNYGTGYDGRSIRTTMTFDNILNYKKLFNVHSVDIMAGSSSTTDESSNNWINGSGYANGDIKTLNGANKISWTGTGSWAGHWAMQSFFARLSYNYNDTYLVTANIRTDGSSKLAPGHKWGFFPSFSAAWRVSQENFLKDIEWISDLKIRGGWGQTGNQSGLGNNSFLAAYNINRIQWFGEGSDANATPTRSQSSLSNPELTWETTTQTDIGFDLSVMKGRLTFYADYYYKKTADMLMWITLPTGSAAANTLPYNGGEIENKGFEFSVSSKNFVKNSFKWNTDFNISFNKNKLLSLNLTQVYYDAVTTDYVKEAVVRNTPGRTLGSFWGYIADGVDPETGELIYRDTNNDGTVSASDRTYIGDPNPDFTFGITNTFSYKGWNLSFLLQGCYGNDVYNVGRMETEGMYDGKNQTTKVLERWRVPGQITDVPKAGFEMHNSTYFLEDGSYIRLKDLSISYDVPTKILKRLHISKLQPYLTATNLLTLTKYSGMDPEVNQSGNSGSVQGLDWGTYPLCKSFSLGLKVEF
ncbi:MAG: TonB-dependent receptor [Bacteroidales bacterium]|nr:TonB-dependent receptor [Bacteroidales bacterium]